MAAEPAPPRRRRGSITLVALCMTTVLGIALGSYLALCLRSTQFSTRQLHLEKARELAQTGLEEALWALNQNTWNASGPDGSTAWTINDPTRTVSLSYALASGGSGSVTLTITNFTATTPRWPTVTSAATLTLPSGETFSKTLQATTGPLPVFAHAVASSESYVKFDAGGTVDSWNSDPDNNPATPAVSYSFTSGVAGNYAAVVAGKDDGTYGVLLTNAEVRGYVATSGQPISYSTSGPSGKVLGPTTASGVDVDPSRIGKSAFIAGAPVISVSTPSTSSSTSLDLLSTLLSVVGQLLTLKVNGDLVVSSSSETYLPVLNPYPSLVIKRPVKLVVTGDLKITDTGRIRITSTGSLELFVAGDITIEGDGFDNETSDPGKLAIYSTSSSTTDTITLNTSQDFHGVIYSENKPIVIGKNLIIYGALLSRNYIRFAATSSFTATAPLLHYDTALRLMQFSGINTPYVTRQVTEL